MLGYSELEVFDPRIVAMWRTACRLIDRFPDRDEQGESLRCHEVARAVRQHLYNMNAVISVVDGRFGLSDHSWLEFWKDGRVVAILDTYAIASLPVCQLVLADSMVGTFSMYEPGPERSDIREDVVAWLGSVAR